MTEAMYHQLTVADQRLQDAERRAAMLKEMPALLAEITGTGATAEGRVQAGWTRDGLTSIDLDPRAMKLPSDELAAAIKQAVRDAQSDYSTRARQAMIDAGVIDPAMAPDPDRLQKMVAEARQQLSSTMRPAADRIAEATAQRRRSGL